MASTLFGGGGERGMRSINEKASRTCFVADVHIILSRIIKQLIQRKLITQDTNYPNPLISELAAPMFGRSARFFDVEIVGHEYRMKKCE